MGGKFYYEYLWLKIVVVYHLIGSGQACHSSEYNLIKNRSLS